MAAAYLDSQLSELLKAYFVDDPSSARDMMEPSKPLGSFSSRIDLSYALGLIGPTARRELHLVRKIRNLFGHEHKPLAFEDATISARCKELHGHQLIAGDAPRSAFTRTVMGLLARIQGETFHTHHRALGKDIRLTRGMKATFRNAERLLRNVFQAEASLRSEAQKSSSRQTTRRPK